MQLYKYKYPHNQQFAHLPDIAKWQLHSSSCLGKKTNKQKKNTKPWYYLWFSFTLCILSISKSYWLHLQNKYRVQLFLITSSVTCLVQTTTFLMQIIAIASWEICPNTEARVILLRNPGSFTLPLCWMTISYFHLSPYTSNTLFHIITLS